MLLCALAFAACQHAENRKSKSIDPIELQASKSYKKEHHLFLNYYFGMSVAEYENATKLNFMKRQVFLSGENQDCELNRYSHRHTREDIDNISKHSVVYYEFDLGKEEFEAVLRPVFKYNRLVKIELQTLNCFNFGNHQHEFYRRKINSTHKALIDLHKDQFGKYQIAEKSRTEHDESVIKNAGVAINQFDTKKYIFNHQKKVITIEQKCCDFKPVIVYTHKAFYDFMHDKSTETERNLENELYHYWGESEI